MFGIKMPQVRILSFQPEVSRKRGVLPHFRLVFAYFRYFHTTSQLSLTAETACTTQRIVGQAVSFFAGCFFFDCCTANIKGLQLLSASPHHHFLLFVSKKLRNPCQVQIDPHQAYPRLFLYPICLHLIFL